MNKVGGLLSIGICITLAPYGQAISASVIPTVFEAGHIFATPQLVNGSTIRLLVDTGGGGPWTYWLGQWSPATRALIKLPPCRIGGDSVEQFQPPSFLGPAIPPPIGPCKGITIVPPENGEILPFDGMLGANYLASRGTWTFDYPAQQLTLEGQDWKPDSKAHPARLGFASTSFGLRRGMARLTISVDGKPLDMLLDTGATAHPTAETQAATEDPVVNHEGVTSYITTSMFDRWHRDHPDWLVINMGDDLFGPHRIMRVIRVPHIEWAGLRLGPVWFTERRDSNFHDMMASMMDRKPEGALGGNVFRHLVLTIDYPRNTAWITCKENSFCKAVKEH